MSYIYDVGRAAAIIVGRDILHVSASSSSSRSSGSSRNRSVVIVD